MNGRRQLDPLFLEGPAVDADVETCERQMPVLACEPAIAKRVEVVGASSPKLVDDLAGVVTHRFAGWCQNRNFLGAKPVFGQRPQGRHQMDVRIAQSIMIHPIGDHAFGRDVALDEVADQGNVLVVRKLDRQSDGHVLGELCIGALFERLNLVPESFRGARDRSIGDHRP